MKYQWRISIRDVPHVLLMSDAGCVSMCYFGRKKIFRIFVPYPYPSNKKGRRSGQQTRGDFKTFEEAWRFCRDLLK